MRVRHAGTFLLVLLAILAQAVPSQAQVIPVYSVIYRPPGIDYLVMRSEHFDVIYQDGTEAQARELAAVLESTLSDVSEIFPTRDDFRLPVVLNRFGHQGNGYVTPIPWKSEIEGTALFGRSLSVRHTDWLMAVGPHELVHAAQGDYSAGFGFNSILRPFAPDLARALNLWVSPGIAEGTAVFLESSLEAGAGRLNHPWFTMQYRAAVGAGNPWTLAQMLEVPGYTRPGDRFYKGGAALMETLADSSGGLPAIRRATAFHNRFPILGYGVSFWYGLGQFPASFGRKQRRMAVEAERSRQEALGPLTESRLILGRKGLLIRKPHWIDNRTVIAYASGYNVRRGLHLIDVESGRRKSVAHHNLTEDLQFSLSVDSKTALASRYIQRPIAQIEEHADVVRISLDSGRAERLTREAGLLAPVEIAAGRIWAIELQGPFNRVVELAEDGSTSPVFLAQRARFVHLEPSPTREQVAIVRNVNGVQGLYLSSVANPELQELLTFSTGSIFDASWSPDGEWILFSADPEDVINAFAFRLSDGSVRQLTNVAYGAFEPSVSPDGTRMVFIAYADQRFELHELPFNPLNDPEPRFGLRENPEPIAYIDTTGVATLAGRYNSLDHLRPRMLYPSLYYEETTSSRPGAELGVGIGLAMQGVDPLERWTYWAEGFYQGERAWGELGLTTSRSVLRPSLRLYRRPDQLLAQIGSGGAADTLNVIRDERGLEFSVRLPVTLRDNVHRSSAFFALFANMEEGRLLGEGSEVLRDWVHNVAITPVASFGFGLQSNIRDLIPSRGLTVHSGTEFEFVPDGFGGPATSSFNEINLFLPWLSRFNTGLKLEAASLSQTRGFVFDTDFFMPRGHEDRVPGRGTFVRIGTEVVQPVLFPDNGMLIIPSFLRAVYVYGFGERLSRANDLDVHLTSVGGGFGVQFSVLHVLSFDLRFGRAYRTGNSPDLGWTTVYR